MMMNSIQLPHAGKIALIIFLGFTIGFLIVSMGSNEYDSELKDVKEDPLLIKPPMSSKMVGGLGAPREKDDEVVEAVNNVKKEFEAKSGKQFESIEVLSYKTQTVAGKNYFVKARVTESGGNTMIVHLRIYLDLGRNYELTAYQLDKKEEDELKHFQ